MKVAISGAHGVGKSTLIASFLDKRPEFTLESEPFEALADDIEMDVEQGPDLDDLAVLLAHSLATLNATAEGTPTIYERCPVDYLAYAAATRTAPKPLRRNFIETHLSRVRDAVHRLDVLVLVPLSPLIAPREHESVRLRRSVDRAFHAILVDDEHDLFGGAATPEVLSLGPDPSRWLDVLMRVTAMDRAFG